MQSTRTVLTKSGPKELAGNELHPGDPAPDFSCLDRRLQPVTLASTPRKPRIFSVIPSIDTPVCDMQTKRFDREAANDDGIAVYSVSVDLPFALGRFADTYGIDHVEMLSDHRDLSFGMNWGVLIPELRLLCRAIFVVDADNVVRYAEYVPELNQRPDFEAALAAARKLAGSAAAAG